MLTLNEQILSLHPNPFLKRIDLRWEEIASIRVSGKHRLFLDITLVTPSIEAFLQRQSPLMRNILAKRIEQTGRIVRFSQRLLPGDLPLSLLHLIQRRYHQQVEQYHIILLDERE